MRIIDKNTDFYDYFQGIYVDRSITFDRTDSFLVTRELMCDYLYDTRSRSRYEFLLLQVCNTFWLFLAEITKRTSYGKPQDYNIILLETWKDYTSNRQLIKFDVIAYRWMRCIWSYNKQSGCYEYDKDKILQNSGVLARSVVEHNYFVQESINKFVVRSGDRTEKECHIPILKACGVSGYIDPLEMYLSIEEYFSLEKTASERTESIGITNKEKIENHGFDVKKSFRGK